MATLRYLHQTNRSALYAPLKRWTPAIQVLPNAPNRIGSGVLTDHNVNDWFNAAAFTTPAQYTFGNSGRNILRGPGLINIDLGLSRVVPITETIRAEFRAETFNFLNTPEFGLPNATLGTSTVGTITTTVNSSRELQFALRLSF